MNGRYSGYKCATNMNITTVKIYPFDTGNAQSSLRAYADVTLNDFLVIKGFRVLVTKSGGLFVGMPSKMGKDGKYYDQVEFKKNSSVLQDRILEAYKEFS
jgi:stage V sporulation protein G